MFWANIVKFFLKNKPPNRFALFAALYLLVILVCVVIWGVLDSPTNIETKYPSGLFAFVLIFVFIVVVPLIALYLIRLDPVVLLCALLFYGIPALLFWLGLRKEKMGVVFCALSGVVAGLFSCVFFYLLNNYGP